ncbi:hypothetical protein PFMG_00808 [Plasmodium falciparum IGH-CR14]|uniref:Uncharacterized protein n=11 Tax=Plasmodium falciparum TaxID=5833 RepID=A0A143ZYK0_PLAF7|nr:conserved protein, unknown function [Plasmodium falciparum 3D7]KAF4331381.1 hypothetical protein CYL21_0200 [Plasmodium falciparum NF54]KNG74639.1 hypothetical protein PFMG_00808 [Plasmodium falciparum IGH-CR14]PKC46304.1 hypothetical protein CK202_3085 [Plasmodium falciparum NF54]CZT98188.1 conserved protein, unknown function [Plasmodium falciparum 3D7]|eukprot:XP_001349678.2 conserved Plasmodium protein, unknown function [Plasmodium falciparum 3D7]
MIFFCQFEKKCSGLFLLRGMRYFTSSKKISNYYSHDGPSVRDMDNEYKKFIEIRKRENKIGDFKITNIDINTFKKYKHKNNPTFSTEFKIFITGIIISMWCVFAIYLTIRIMSPDNFDWVEDERKRLEDAKKKIILIKEKNMEKSIAE